MRSSAMTHELTKLAMHRMTSIEAYGLTSLGAKVTPAGTFLIELFSSYTRLLD